MPGGLIKINYNKVMIKELKIQGLIDLLMNLVAVKK